MIYKELSFGDFYDEFKRAGRDSSWSYDALRALYDYLEDMGTDYELDVIALDCEYSWVNMEEVKKDYMAVDFEEEELEDMPWNECIEWLDERTTVIPCGYEQAVIYSF
jgi:hypothetical protein